MIINENKIAFIVCVNDEAEYEECRFYLDALHIPKGYMTDVIKVEGAPSMAAGYNAGMKDSDAKYKVYLHQDVFIINENFIEDLLRIFAGNRQIGLLGMIGNKDVGTKAFDVQVWDAGAIIDCRMPWKSAVPSREDVFSEVQAVDGLLLATQYDIPWREDVFDGWHFYDISQCMEFKKAGYQVAVPWQETPWCDHDNLPSSIAVYYDFYERFVREYAEWTEIPEKRDHKVPSYEKEKEYMELLGTMKSEVEQLITIGTPKARRKLRELFHNSGIQGMHEMMEYESVVHIDEMEEYHHSELHIWENGMSWSRLQLRWRALKHALKRMVYKGVDGPEKVWIWKNYSPYAVQDICNRYAFDPDMMKAENG